MMDYQIDNPMTLGDYPDEDGPIVEQTCPFCHRVWEGYDVDGDIVWQYEDIDTTDCDPVQNGKCRICAWKSRTRKDEMRYIKQNNLQKDLLEYWLGINQSPANITRDSCNELWTIMKEHEPDFLSELISSYIEDGERNDFVDWMLDGGANANGST